MSDKPQPEPTPEVEEHEDHDGSRLGLRRRLGRLLDRKDLAEDTQSMLGGVLDISDRAKTEVVRLMAREVRNYMDEMKVKEEVMDLITGHSLEMKLSLHLKPLADAVREEPKPARKRPVPAPEPAEEPELESTEANSDDD